ncbi:MAG: hypothetical protein E7035_07825 [Verrucomicrobiaceae bacterium]|nr:hypothetical protein [Verrucomicrobiaceae bacterium]
MKIRINSITEIEVEQIKLVAKLFVGEKELSGHLNKTLDSSIIQHLPSEIVGNLTSFAFGKDFTSEELLALAEQIKAIAEQKQQEGTL